MEVSAPREMTRLLRSAGTGAVGVIASATRISFHGGFLDDVLNAICQHGQIGKVQPSRTINRDEVSNYGRSLILRRPHYEEATRRETRRGCHNRLRIREQMESRRPRYQSETNRARPRGLRLCAEVAKKGRQGVPLCSRRRQCHLPA